MARIPDHGSVAPGPATTYLIGIVIRFPASTLFPSPGFRPEKVQSPSCSLDSKSEWLAKLTGFWNEVKDPVSNVTLTGPFPPDCPAGTVCRQRQNLGRTRSRGLEAELHYRPTRAWDLFASYLYNDSEVLEFPADPSLEGKRVPQVPKHTYTLGAQYLHPRLFNVALQGRFVGDQFEDDRNANGLDSFFVVDLNLWRPVPLPYVAASEVFVAVENLFDTTYAVGKDPTTGVVSVGAPLLLHGGIRWRF